jgi:hypothetical protein
VRFVVEEASELAVPGWIDAAMWLGGDLAPGGSGAVSLSQRRPRSKPPSAPG